MGERFGAALGVALAVAMLWLLYLYVFVWGNSPNLGRLIGLDV